MKVEVIKCGISELNYIRQALEEVKGEEDCCRYDENNIRKFLGNNDNWFYIALSEGRVCGYAIAYVQRRIDTDSNMICLYEIGTLRSYRKMGIGKFIINRIIEDGKAEGAYKIWIPTNTSNKAACALYRSIGAREPDKIDDIIYNYKY